MTHTSNAESFLLAAKRSEINALHHLMLSSKLVIVVSNIIHELQKERGLSNCYLVSEGQRLASEYAEAMEATNALLQTFQQTLGTLDLEHCGSSTTRLYNSLAYALHTLEGLPNIRSSIASCSLSATENTKFFNHLIAGLLTVIFEAADVSNDPDITRILVALFNFLQGKEYAGQERAWGVIGFTTGTFSNGSREQIKALQDAQQNCLDIFSEFSTILPAAQLRQLESNEATSELQRMRQLIARFRSGDSLPTSIGEVWFQAASARIDSMLDIANQLTHELEQLCQSKLSQAEEELRLHEEHLVLLASYEEPPMSALTAMDTQSKDTSINLSRGVHIKLAGSIYELVQRQSEHLRQVSEELASAKQTLNERKLIEKAKGILMMSQHVSEEDAYKQLRQAAMTGNKRIIDIAENIISVASMLKSK